MTYAKILSITLLTSFFMLFSSCASNSENKSDETTEDQPDVVIHSDDPLEKSDTKIQVALLLDTSNSMDGLIEQAKSRLWNIVNTLTTLRYEGKMPTIEIALYEYGNMGLSPSTNYIRKVVSLTTDLDLISEQLFSLTTNGGDEYCGAVIEDASKMLEWGRGEHDMRLMYVAGNEEFNQGGVAYKKAIGQAREKDIYVNTIFCGDRTEGILTFWEEGAKRGKGSYFNINQDVMIEEIATPYDEKISQLNYQLNGTYISYGKLGMEKKSNQMAQDQNARSISYSVATDRAISKSNAAYENESWDLVDKLKENKEALKTIKREELPAELRGKSNKQVEKYVEQKSKERLAIQQKIGELARKRQTYIEEHTQTAKGDDLGKAIVSSIIQLARKKGYTVAK